MLTLTEDAHEAVVAISRPSAPASPAGTSTTPSVDLGEQGTNR